jgi:hypothetical protein
VYLIAGVVLGALAAALNLIVGWDLLGVALALALVPMLLLILLAYVGLLKWFYFFAFVQPERSIPATRPILRLLRGLLNVALAGLLVGVVANLLALLLPRGVSPPTPRCCMAG